MHIVSITIEQRKETVPNIQEILTKYGENIHSRLGLHTVEEKREVIIIVYLGNDIENFINELKQKENVIVNYMEVN